MADAGCSLNGPSLSLAVAADSPVHVVDGKLTIGLAGGVVEVPAMAESDTTGVGVARNRRGGRSNLNTSISQG
jgi:hypothetical protein